MVRTHDSRIFSSRALRVSVVHQSSAVSWYEADVGVLWSVWSAVQRVQGGNRVSGRGFKDKRRLVSKDLSMYVIVVCVEATHLASLQR